MIEILGYIGTQKTYNGNIQQSQQAHTEQKKLKAFPPESEIRQGYLSSSFLFNTLFKDLARE